MNAKNTSVLLASAVVLTAAAWGCDERPKGLLRFPGAPTPVPAEGVLTHLVIGGPSSVPPGETAQFTVTAHYADATTRDVSGEAVWLSSDSSVLSLSPTGLATALERGAVTITVSFEGRNATKPDVTVLPAGTFRLVGTVRDAGLLLPNARVSVVSGTGAGLSTTATDGEYRLYGIAGDVQIRASRAGYQDAVKQVRVIADWQVLDFEMSLAGSRGSVAGTHTLAITAAATCTDLPGPARTRTYTAHITQDGARAFVALEGAEFFKESWGLLNRFQGTVLADLLVLRLGPGFDYYFYLPEVVEILETPSSSYLAFIGEASLPATGHRPAGSFNGLILTMDSRFRRIVTCRSPDHRFELTRVSSVP